MRKYDDCLQRNEINYTRENVDTNNYKYIDLVFDNPFFYALKIDKLKSTASGWVYDDEMSKYGHHGEEIINVRFDDVEYSYQILELLGSYWGGWNSTPESSIMSQTAKKWYEKYGAELVKISHDTLTFNCRRLSETEAKEIMNEVIELDGLIIDCKPEELLEHLMNKETFNVWWD